MGLQPMGLQPMGLRHQPRVLERQEPEWVLGGSQWLLSLASPVAWCSTTCSSDLASRESARRDSIGMYVLASEGTSNEMAKHMFVKTM
mmetsp:Transcript_49230/g.126891  ORF Transcript_49230/g.126891 Transcript_49230/m.126891 type:complete len:88 (-) Transcript_49230:176-439(-)